MIEHYNTLCEASTRQQELVAEGKDASIWFDRIANKWALEERPVEYRPGLKELKWIHLSPEEKELIEKGIPEEIVRRAAYKRMMETVKDVCVADGVSNEMKRYRIIRGIDWIKDAELGERLLSEREILDLVREGRIKLTPRHWDIYTTEERPPIEVLHILRYIEEM